jgi:NAD(P)-dependent dehydrogenase (short-subunit alcohol dehydrogenase family)
MDLKLADKVAVVTGANKGIGFAVTEALVAEGALVVAGSRSTENLDGLDRVIAMPVDLARAACSRRGAAATTPPCSCSRLRASSNGLIRRLRGRRTLTRLAQHGSRVRWPAARTC